MFYSKSTSGFYSDEINGVNIPNDAIEISDDYYQYLLDQQVRGNVIIFDESTKKPIAVTPVPLSDTQLAEDARRQRDNLLTASDWTQVSDAPVDQQAWRTYREILRQVPEQAGFPLNIAWPVQPEK
ncbi:putative phage tail fibre protein [Dickeya chrysanthemi Ech1591]|uniref:Putative phage tail fibre protein n=1 Tax=Dickeya chrysanthemi (strain Ech1591) TaxID=561229 RepID=C6CP87_DICC1|nr:MULTISPECIES: tail fiber assembly protein [Dickeya]ACT08828.1 putative phage tail fibre protein [Dickeya chrysanthemi Ech1591]TYL41955.1 phage tail protein [Dickeya sp. ws52]